MTKHPCSGMILAGRSEVPKPLTELMMNRCDETIVVAEDPLHHLGFGGLIVADSRRSRFPFSAIYAGLFAANHPHAMAVDARYSHMTSGLLQYLLDAVAPRWDLVIPETDAGLAPGLAVYSKRSLKPMTRHLDRASFRPADFFAKLNKRVISSHELKAIDPGWGPANGIDTV